MPAEELKRPDEAAMFRILARHPYSPEGVILRLAWQEGLSRKELNELTWDQVDLDGGSILLPDRAVPLEPSVADCLRERYARYRKLSNRVLIADRGKKPMTPENVSRLAKNVLDSEGQDVSLKDLRRDWIVRQIKASGWAYAAVSAAWPWAVSGAFFPPPSGRTPPSRTSRRPAATIRNTAFGASSSRRAAPPRALPSGCAGSSKCSRGRSSP